MRAACDEAGEMRDVDHEERTDRVADLANRAKSQWRE
jgi:hypothetical protein